MVFVLTSVKTARVAVISWTTHFPADWMRSWTAWATAATNEVDVARVSAVEEAKVLVAKADWSMAVVDERVSIWADRMARAWVVLLRETEISESD